MNYVHNSEPNLCVFFFHKHLATHDLNLENERLKVEFTRGSENICSLEIKRSHKRIETANMRLEKNRSPAAYLRKIQMKKAKRLCMKHLHLRRKMSHLRKQTHMRLKFGRICLNYRTIFVYAFIF